MGKNGLESAFPQQRVWSPEPGKMYIEPGGAVKTETLGGLSKREWLAGMALQGMVTRPGWTIADMVANAVAYADALLLELEK